MYNKSGDKMKFLITGFEPFSRNETNPSGDILKDLKSENIETLLLPVSYLRVRDLLEAKIKEVKPDIVISLGLANKRAYLSLELCAINYQRASITDNDNNLITGKLIKPNGKEAYFTSLNLNDLLKVLAVSNIKADISTSAGSYVCNTVYYNLLELQEKYNYKGLFIHLPSYDNLSYNDEVKALLEIIKYLNN